jgi:ABC-type sugar transport system ATPase subunit
VAAIILSSVKKTFPGFELGPFDLEIRDNEFFGIFGPPSCGKTSILKIILGLLTPDDGTVEIDGEDVSDFGADRRNLAMVFQNLALFPHMTAKQNIMFPLNERGVPKEEADKRLDRVSELLHISHVLDKTPDKLSGGERQRVALGRAFVRNPVAFLLDEPIAALDARLREEMRVELKRLQREGNHTFVYVSHDEEEVLGISDRVAIVEDGAIAQVGTPDEIYDRPRTLYVATMVGSPPMNILSGQYDAKHQLFISEEFGLKFDVKVDGDGDGLVDAKIGVRPESLTIVFDKSENAIAGRIIGVETLGAITIVDVVSSSEMLKVRVSGQANFDEGQPVFLDVPVDRVHLFDDDGIAIMHPRGL